MPINSPFSFCDQILEHNYQEHFLVSNYDRFEEICKYLVPVLFLFRTFPIICWFLGYSVDSIELFYAVFKLCLTIIVLIIFSKSWSRSAKFRFGLLLLWALRVNWLLAAVSQARGLNMQATTSFVLMVCLSGLMMPNILEYFCWAIGASFIRPIQLSFTGNSDSNMDLIMQAIYQHSLVMALGMSIVWTFHCDFRRAWLRSPSKSIKPAKRRKSAIALNAPIPRTEKRGFDELDDGYFTESDRSELSAEVLKVGLGLVRCRWCPPRLTFGYGRIGPRSLSDWRSRRIRFHGGTGRVQSLALARRAMFTRSARPDERRDETRRDEITQDDMRLDKKLPGLIRLRLPGVQVT
jgi:hypothetical protein